MFCQIRPTPHYIPMKSVIWLPSSCALFLILTGCSNQSVPETGPGTGPFDSAGNYIENWADDPSKWRKPGSRTPAPADDLPVITKNEQPPANANPLGPQVVANKPAPKIESTPRETVRTESPKPVVTKPKPKPVVVKTKPKPKPKPKPKTTRYVVKKGDSLSTIAARNGSSVSAIQRANGISGTLIRPGQSLVVPKR
jgi:LysM repeat protein